MKYCKSSHEGFAIINFIEIFHRIDEYETKWVGLGEDVTCTDGKLLWESTVVKLEEMVSYVEFKYYHAKKETFTVDQISDKVSVIDTTNGRCYSIILTSDMIKQGIRHVEFGFVSMSRIYFHTPGVFEYEADRKATIQNSREKKSYYMIEHELLEMLDDQSRPCNEDPNYNKDTCAQDEIQMYLMKEYGCTPPLFENKDKICTNETIAQQVWKYWESTKYKTNCTDPCKVMLVRAMWMTDKIKKDSSTRLYFRGRVKVVKSYYAYSGLTLIAEIGGYFGLFLGVSINQITYVLSFVQERVQKYF